MDTSAVLDFLTGIKTNFTIKERMWLGLVGCDVRVRRTRQRRPEPSISWRYERWCVFIGGLRKRHVIGAIWRGGLSFFFYFLMEINQTRYRSRQGDVSCRHRFTTQLLLGPSWRGPEAIVQIGSDFGQYENYLSFSSSIISSLKLHINRNAPACRIFGIQWPLIFNPVHTWAFRCQ